MDVLQKAQADGAKIHLKTAGLNIMTSERDLNAFTGEIDESEKILCIITGKLVQLSNDRSRGILGAQATGTDTKGVMVITDQKAVFMDKRLFGKQVTIIDGGDLVSITASSGIISSRVEINTVGGRYDITDVKKEGANDAVAALNVCKKGSKAAAAGGTIVNQAASGMEEIKKAKELFDAGIISQAEFEAIKKKHIG